MDQNTPVQTGETPVVPTPAPTPTFTVAPKKKFPKWIFLVLVILAILSWGFFFWQKSKSQQVLDNKVVTSANLPKSSAQQAKLSNKIIYATLDSTGKMDVFASDYSGNQQKLYEEASVSAVFKVSHDNSELAYQSSKTPNSLSIYNFLTKAGKAYPLEASAGAVKDVSWSNSGKELLMIEMDKLEKLSLVGGQVENIGSLNLGSIFGSADKLGSEMGYANFVRMDNSAHTFLITGELCAPGPCYKNLYSYDWQTGELKNVLDFSKLTTDEQFSDVKTSGDSAVFNDTNMEANAPVSLQLAGVAGKISLLKFLDGSLTDLVSTPSAVLNGSKFIDDKTILYNLVKSVPGEATPSSQWYEMNLDSKKSQQINYSGYDLVPFNRQTGLIDSQNADGSELDILDLTSGKKTQLVKSADSQVYLLNSVF